MNTELATHTDNQGGGLLMMPNSMNEAIEFANVVAKCDLLPDHLKNKPGNCIRVISQAAQWGMDFFGVADCTSIIHGKVMYEGKLISAVINARGNLKSRLRYDFEGEGNKRVLTVSGTIKGEDEARTIKLTYDEACEVNKNGQMKKQPEQQMCYIGARIWARRHMPELMMGVYTPDEYDEDAQTDDDGIAGTPPKRPNVPKKNKGAAAAMSATKPEPKPAEKVEDPKPAEKVEEPKEAAKPEPKPVEKVEDKEPPAEEPKSAEKAEDKEPTATKAEPRTILEEGEVISGNFAIEEFADKSTKSGEPVRVLIIKGDEYHGMAFSKDMENKHTKRQGLVYLEIVGNQSPSGVKAIVEKAEEARVDF